jgi:predicted  nucleic acid-binding Zn-ribbon protein
MPMQKTFDKLRKLQEVLLDEFQFEEELEDIPKELNDLKRKHHKIERTIAEKETIREKNEKLTAEIAKEKEQLNKDREKYESQIPLIKTQREYEAITSEIAMTSEKLKNIEETEMEAYQEIESINTELEELKSTMEELEGTISGMEKEVKQSADGKKKELNGCLKEKSKIASGLDEEVIYKFEKIVRNKDGIGIVSVKNNVCMGCNMQLPPQFVNDVRREDHLIFCPNCSRILYYQGDEEPAEELIV